MGGSACLEDCADAIVAQADGGPPPDMGSEVDAGLTQPEAHETTRLCELGRAEEACWSTTELFRIDLTDPDAANERDMGHWRIDAVGPNSELINNGCRWHGESRPEIRDEGIAMGPTDAITCEDSGDQSFSTEAFMVTVDVEFTVSPIDNTYEVLVNKQATPDGWTEGQEVNSNLDNFMLGRRGTSAFCKFETENPIVIDDQQTTNPIVWLNVPGNEAGWTTVWSCGLFPTETGSTLVLQIGDEQATLQLPGHIRPLTGPGGLQIGGPDLVSDHSPDRLLGSNVRAVYIDTLEWTPAP
ncbi:MAG: hypothetical protein KC925_02820 [Candidatus Doudnabacteria bacterium]|nr:hypothetical protein [Candidatus Doudnabacteria bacterium]